MKKFYMLIVLVAAILGGLYSYSCNNNTHIEVAKYYLPEKRIVEIQSPKENGILFCTMGRDFTMRSGNPLSYFEGKGDLVSIVINRSDLSLVEKSAIGDYYELSVREINNFAKLYNFVQSHGIPDPVYVYFERK